MDQRLEQVLSDLQRFEVQLVMRKPVKASLPPTVMTGLAFTFNGHETLGAHARHLRKSLQQAREALDELALEGRGHSGPWMTEVRLLEIELANRLISDLHEGSISGPKRLLSAAEAAWHDLVADIGIFVQQQTTLHQQLLVLIEAAEALPVVAEAAPVKVEAEAPRADFGWNGNKADLIEVFLALEERGAIWWRQADWSMKERMDRFSNMLGVEVKNLHQTIPQLMLRSKGPAIFLSSCVKALEGLRDQRDEVKTR